MYPFSLNIISCIETDKSNNIQIHHSTVVPLTTRNQLLVSSPRCKLFSLAMHMTFLTISLQHQLLYLATKGVYTHYNSLCLLGAKNRITIQADWWMMIIIQTLMGKTLADMFEQTLMHTQQLQKCHNLCSDHKMYARVGLSNQTTLPVYFWKWSGK